MIAALDLGGIIPLKVLMLALYTELSHLYHTYAFPTEIQNDVKMSAMKQVCSFHYVSVCIFPIHERRGLPSSFVLV